VNPARRQPAEHVLDIARVLCTLVATMGIHSQRGMHQAVVNVWNLMTDTRKLAGAWLQHPRRFHVGDVPATLLAVQPIPCPATPKLPVTECTGQVRSSLTPVLSVR
jgi:hypothetical protein